MGSTPISSFQSLPKLKGGQRTGVICREIRGEHGGPGVLRISGLWGLIIRLALTAVGQPPRKDFGGTGRIRIWGVRWEERFEGEARFECRF